MNSLDNDRLKSMSVVKEIIPSIIVVRFSFNNSRLSCHQ